MSNNNSDVYVGIEVYVDSDVEDGLYESDITCTECDEPIGAWQHDTQDSTVETFTPYYMCDEDNNYNVCEACYDLEQVKVNG